MNSSNVHAGGFEGPLRVGGAGSGRVRLPTFPRRRPRTQVGPNYDPKYSEAIPRRIRRGSARLEPVGDLWRTCGESGDNPSTFPRGTPKPSPFSMNSEFENPGMLRRGAAPPGRRRGEALLSSGPTGTWTRPLEVPMLGASPTAGGRRSGSETRMPTTVTPGPYLYGTDRSPLPQSFNQGQVAA